MTTLTLRTTGRNDARRFDDAVLLHYRVTARWKHEAEPIVALASSVYVQRANEWKLAFHHQTEIPGP